MCGQPGPPGQTFRAFTQANNKMEVKLALNGTSYVPPANILSRTQGQSDLRKIPGEYTAGISGSYPGLWGATLVKVDPFVKILLANSQVAH